MFQQFGVLDVVEFDSMLNLKINITAFIQENARGAGIFFQKFFIYCLILHTGIRANRFYGHCIAQNRFYTNIYSGYIKGTSQLRSRERQNTKFRDLTKHSFSQQKLD